MTDENLKLLISDCLEQIAERDESIASYWVEQLIDLQTGEIKPHMINEMTLQSLERDVVAVYDYELDMSSEF